LLLDRVDLGDAGSEALWERKAFGVFPGLVLVPAWDGLAVVVHDGDTLSVRGDIPVTGGVLRGFPYGANIVAAGAEEVVVSQAANLAVQGRVTVAENVVDIGRLADGRLIKLVQAGDLSRIEGVDVPLWAEALYTYGNSAAIIGWDNAGRAAYVVSYNAAAPIVSGRLDLGWHARPRIAGGRKPGPHLQRPGSRPHELGETDHARPPRGNALCLRGRG
jgi:hypothetical protein